MVGTLTAGRYDADLDPLPTAQAEALLTHPSVDYSRITGMQISTTRSDLEESLSCILRMPHATQSAIIVSLDMLRREDS